MKLTVEIRFLSSSDIVLRLRKPPLEEISILKKGSIHISFLDPFNEKALVQALAQHQISAFSMEMIPRTTRAQKMDALSSQANLAGYVTVILAAERLPKIFPMLMTAAGTIAPARVFIIGVGVAGLQAIATAKRLGARVEAFDTRPVVKEQEVQSLGAKFVEIDLGETGQTCPRLCERFNPRTIREAATRHGPSLHAIRCDHHHGSIIRTTRTHCFKSKHHCPNEAGDHYCGYGC